MARILNIAHRGFTRDYPDNTKEAFEAAIALGVDGIECDVHETADGRFVIHHDADVDGRRIAEMGLAEIRQIELAGGCRIPTLEQTLLQTDERVLLNVEIKRVKSLWELIQMIRSRTSARNVILTSFDRDFVFGLATAAPDFRRGVISMVDEDYVSLAKKTASDVAAPYFGHVTADVVAGARAASLPLFVWGCRDMAETKAVLALGVDGIVTDFADEAAQEIAALAGD